MVKFAHIADVHLGGWKQQPLQDLNLASFKKAVEVCIHEKVEFAVIAGDLFDNAFPPIDVLKETFAEFKKLKDSGIPCFLISGSHDYSVSGKTFLDVLDKAGFCKNVEKHEIINDKIILLPTIYKNIAINGYPGKKSGLEVEEIERIKIQDSPGLFKILMLHTAIRDAVPNLMIKAVDERNLPKVDYLALSHLHIHYNKSARVYSGPTFPNSLLELEELQGGSFYIFDNGIIKKQDLKLKQVFSLNLEIKEAHHAVENIISILQKENLKDKIFILKLFGVLTSGKSSDIDFLKISEFAKKSGAYAFLKSTSRLNLSQPEIKLDFFDSENIESKLIQRFQDNNPNKFNSLISQLFKTLQMEKLDDEKSLIFEERLLSDILPKVNSYLKNEI